MALFGRNICDARIVIGVVSSHVGGRGGRTGFEIGSMSPLLTSCRLHIVNIGLPLIILQCFGFIVSERQTDRRSTDGIGLAKGGNMHKVHRPPKRYVTELLFC